MANSEQATFVQIVKYHLPKYFSGTRVVEMGSLDINGSARNHFENADYVGVDLGAGSSVDLIMPGHLVDEPTGSFDCSISANCFEHNPFWLETFINMLRLTREGGMVLFTCASTGFREHGTARSAPEASPLTLEFGWDYYKNLVEQDFTRRLDLRQWCADWRFFVDYDTYCLYFVAIRGELGKYSLPMGLLRDVGDQVNPFRSVRALKRRIKVALFGNFLSSPPSHYLRRRR